MKELKRRDFLKYASWGVATLVVGCGGGGGGGGVVVDPGNGGGGDDGGGDGGGNGGGPGEIVETLNFTITDIMKEMITHEPDAPFPAGGNEALCYYWVFKEDRFPADNPAPQIFCLTGDRIAVNVTNNLDGPHAFFIPGAPGQPPMVESGPIQPGETWSGEFIAGAPGTYLYHDNLNAPVNRVMGLHGALVVMPTEAVAGRKFTPYANPTAGVQQLFDDFGSAPWWPGLAWEEGDAVTETDPFRQYVWLVHEASPVLFAEVGAFAEANPGQDFPAQNFMNAWFEAPFLNTNNDARADGVVAGFPRTEEFNRKPHFFTINGQSGFFAHHNPAITPFHRVGEPCVVRILNAGMDTHSLHLHANHFYVTMVNNVPQENPIWVDVYNIFPGWNVDYTIPVMRPPDIPNARGIGRANSSAGPDQGLPTATGTTWPPTEELNQHFPRLDLAVLQSPLCYPMHDHTEPSQVAQGGNYNCGMIAGLYILGDRNTLGGITDFPKDPEFIMMLEHGRHNRETGPPVGGWPDGVPAP